MDIEEAKRRARKGPLLLIARRVFAVLITLLSTVTIARLVAPREYGLANMSLVIVSFGQIFRDFGLTNAILRKGVINQEEMSLAFWFNAAMTLLVTLALAMSAPSISAFYHEPVVTWIILVSLIGFVLSGLSLQHRALLNRELRFSAIASIDSGAQLVGYLLTLALALKWHSVWAIVYGNLAQTIATAIGYVTTARWRPGRPRRSEELSDLLKFGANASVFTIAVFVSQNAATLLIGRFLGAAPLGQYNRAWALFQMPVTNLIEPIAQATMPLLTRLRQDAVEYRAAYLILIRKLNTALMPLSVLLLFAGVPVVEAVLGPRWHNAGAAFAALSSAFAGMGVAYAIGDLFVTQNRAGELRTLGLLELVIRVGAVWLAMPYGLTAIAAGYALSTLTVAVLRLMVVGRKGPVTVRDQLGAIAPSLPLGIGAAIGCGLGSLVIWEAEVAAPILRAALLLAIGGGLALAGGLIVRTSRTALVELATGFGLTAFVNLAARLFRITP